MRAGCIATTVEETWITEPTRERVSLVSVPPYDRLYRKMLQQSWLFYIFTLPLQHFCDTVFSAFNLGTCISAG